MIRSFWSWIRSWFVSEQTEDPCAPFKEAYEQEKKAHQRVAADLLACIEDLSYHKEQLSNFNPSVKDASYWNTKWPQKDIRYAAPHLQKVQKYLEYDAYPAVRQQATKIIRDYALGPDNVDAIGKAVMEWNLKQEIVYARQEKPDVWYGPLETHQRILKNLAVDCDDMAIYQYYIIREIFMNWRIWDAHKHRLKVVDCHTFQDHYSGIRIYAGRHLCLIWLAEDAEWYTIEGIGSSQRTEVYRAKNAWLRIPMRLERMYGAINYTFNEEYAWAENQIVYK